MITRKLLGKVAIAMIPIAAGVVLVASSNPLVVRMQGPCEPVSFNAAVGPGTCSGSGEITFAHLIAELTAAQKVGAWHFDPTNVTVAAGTALSLENRAGEVHTFTKVKAFGGGFVAPLNALSGNPVPAPECALVTMGGLIPKPESPSHIRGAVHDRGRSHGWWLHPAERNNNQVHVLCSPLDAYGVDNAIGLTAPRIEQHEVTRQPTFPFAAKGHSQAIRARLRDRQVSRVSRNRKSASRRPTSGYAMRAQRIR